MDRRNFLKLTAAGSLAVLVGQLTSRYFSVFSAPFWTETDVVEWGGKLFKGTMDGRILSSTDGGATWSSSANFGEQCRVEYLSAVDGRLFALLGVSGGRFTLASVDGSVWLTS